MGNGIKIDEAVEAVKHFDRRVRFGSITIAKHDGEIVLVDEKSTVKDANDLPHARERASGQIPGVRK